MTTYYLKTFECIFPFNWGGSGDSVNGMLTAFVDTDPFVRSKIDHTLKFQDQQIFFLAGSSVAPEIPPSNVGTPAIYLQTLPGIYFYWNDKRLDTTLGFSGYGWSIKSWTSPDVDYSTWLQELVDYTETAKGTNADWGTDNGEVNIYIFKYKYNNQPTWSSYGYYVIAYKGNDYTRDLELTPTP